MRPRSSPDLARKLALMPEVELVGLSAAGDRDAYGELVRRHARFVRDLLRRMGADHALADDLAQDAFIEALHSLPTYRLEAPFPAWIRTVAARLYIRRRQKDARTVITAEPMADDPGDIEAASSNDRLDLDTALKTLSPAERLCVTLCHGAGLRQDEISEALGVPLGTVKSHVTRGLKKLRRRLMLGEPPTKGGPQNG
ncbi:MAG TPA: sigma-70 family RNA polymerase sigma factor [Hyphomonadaceae bacterium]|jgi:RNA polymerase sigma-70 factor (ECF subfamily)|nr:sigma-70 family RNA polymerase sigma factor [Hyphomonadaceae bacterium]